jgi:hypothetical protein
MGVYQMDINEIASKTNEIQLPYKALLIIPNPASEDITFQIDDDVIQGKLSLQICRGRLY